MNNQEADGMAGPGDKEERQPGLGQRSQESQSAKARKLFSLSPGLGDEGRFGDP